MSAKECIKELERVVKKVSLKEDLLVKPPFRFLLDVIADVRKNTGYGKDVYSDSDLNPSSYKDKDAKTKFLAKIVAKVEKDTGKAPAKASDLVNGDSAKTCEFLILFAKTAHKSKRTSQSSGASRSSTGSKKSSGSSKKHRSSSPKKSSSKGNSGTSSSSKSRKSAPAPSLSSKSGKSKSREPTDPEIAKLPTAIVKAVPTGDTLILLGKPKNPKEAPREKLLMLASLYAPRFALSKNDEEEPFGWTSREFLRKRVIGKTVHFRVEYKIERYGNREFGAVYYHDENLSHTLVKEGLANVIPADDGEPRAKDYEKLLKLEEDAQVKNRGMFTGDDDLLLNASRTILWSGVDGVSMVKKWKGKPIPAIVEQVLNGSTLRVWLMVPHWRYAQLFLSGIQCPGFRPPEYAGGPEQPAPFAREAKLFTERRLLHRDVQVVIEDVDNAQKGFKKVAIQNYIGTIIIPDKPEAKIREELLKEGLARVDEGSTNAGLKAAQKMGQERRVRLWKLSPVIDKKKVLEVLGDKNPWVRTLALHTLDGHDLKDPAILRKVFSLFSDEESFTIPKRVLSDEEKEFVENLVEVMENKESWWDRCIKPDKKRDERTEGRQMYWVHNMAQRILQRDDKMLVGKDTLSALVKGGRDDKKSPHLVRHWIDQNFRRFEWGNDYEAAYKEYTSAALEWHSPCLQFMFKGTREKLLAHVANEIVKAKTINWDTLKMLLRKGQDVGAKAAIEALDANADKLPIEALPILARVANREYYPKKAMALMKKMEKKHPIAAGYLALFEKSSADDAKKAFASGKITDEDALVDLVTRVRDLKWPKHYPTKELMECLEDDIIINFVRWADFPDDVRQQLLKRILTGQKGYVKAVLSGDTIVVVAESDVEANKEASGPPPEKLITLASLMAPVLSRGPSSPDMPYAWASREWLRKTLIGKNVSFRVEYHEPQKREFATVFLGDQNINDLAVLNGWCKVQPIEGTMPHSQDFEHLCQLELEANKARRGVWNEGEAEANTRKAIWSYDKKKFLSENKGKEMKALVEQVVNGAQLRICELGSYHYFMVVLAGVQCPEFKKSPNPAAPPPAQPFAREAKFFTEDKLLNREVVVTLQSLTREGQFVGAVAPADGSFDIREELLGQGLAKVVAGEKASDKLKAAESSAREKKLRVWKKPGK